MTVLSSTAVWVCVFVAHSALSKCISKSYLMYDCKTQGHAGHILHACRRRLCTLSASDVQSSLDVLRIPGSCLKGAPADVRSHRRLLTLSPSDLHSFLDVSVILVNCKKGAPAGVHSVQIVSQFSNVVTYGAIEPIEHTYTPAFRSQRSKSPTPSP